MDPIHVLSPLPRNRFNSQYLQKSSSQKINNKQPVMSQFSDSPRTNSHSFIQPFSYNTPQKISNANLNMLNTSVQSNSITSSNLSDLDHWDLESSTGSMYIQQQQQQKIFNNNNSDLFLSQFGCFKNEESGQKLRQSMQNQETKSKQVEEQFKNQSCSLEDVMRDLERELNFEE